MIPKYISSIMLDVAIEPDRENFAKVYIYCGNYAPGGLLYIQVGNNPGRNLYDGIKEYDIYHQETWPEKKIQTLYYTDEQLAIIEEYKKVSLIDAFATGEVNDMQQYLQQRHIFDRTKFNYYLDDFGCAGECITGFKVLVDGVWQCYATSPEIRSVCPDHRDRFGRWAFKTVDPETPT
jgi:hypothetical protein